MTDAHAALNTRHIPQDWSAPLSLTSRGIEHPGPIVVALAGAGCSPAIYDAVADDAGRDPGLPWVTLDWFMGEGDFDPETIATRLAAVLARRRGPTVLAGHSLGAFLSLLVALRHGRALGSRLAGLIVSNTGARTVGHGDPSLPDRILRHWTAAAQEAFLAACFHRPPVEPLASHLKHYLAAVPVQRLHAAVAGLRTMDILHELSGVACPVLVAHGEHDRKRSIDTAREMAECLRDARLVLLSAGHTPMVECPSDYHAQIRAFLLERSIIAP